MHLFTRKEAEVVSYILKGFTYKQIALVMHISITTVNDHQKKIYKITDQLEIRIDRKADVQLIYICSMFEKHPFTLKDEPACAPW